MKFQPEIVFGKRKIGANAAPFVIAELSANHGHKLETALEIVRCAAQAGADAVKMQTYTAETLTIQSDRPDFQVGSGTLWEGRTLYDLYKEAYTPWEWHRPIKDLAESLGMEFFSTPFDATAVDYLEALDVQAYKIASFEIVDVGLIAQVARKGRPIILSTGMASKAEIQEALDTIAASGNDQVALLKCTSGYPAREEEMNLRTIPAMRETFGVPIGLSDHTLTSAVPAAAVALGACIIEKHITLSRADGGPDAAFSLEPSEFAQMVSAVQTAWKAIGTVSHDCGKHEASSRAFRRSLYVVEDMAAGETFTEKNVRSIRPGHGLHTRHLPAILGSKTKVALARGTALAWEHLEEGKPPATS